MPDLGVLAHGQRCAIEVELHAKAPDRLRGIMRGYRWKIDYGELAAVGYVTTKPAVARLVRREGDVALLGNQLELITLGQIIKGTRSREP